MLEVGDGVFEVLSTSGDTHLGGDDFDKVGPALLYLSSMCFGGLSSNEFHCDLFYVESC